MVHQTKGSVLILLWSLAVCGCDSKSPVAPSDVIGPTWLLVSIERAGSPPLVVENPSRYTLRFEADGRLAAMSDCNGCGGTYQLSGSTVSMKALQCTLVACPQGSLDSQYRSALERAQSLARDDDELVIEGGSETLRFRQ
jgi:heat shock protein HslJ